MLMIAALVITNCKSTKSNTAEVVEEPQPDEYAILGEQNRADERTLENLSGTVIVLTEKEFSERITEINNPKGFRYLGQTPCVVEFFAHWCKPCAAQSALMNDMAPDYKGKVIFYKLDIDKAYSVRDAFNVESIPMMLYFKPRGAVFTTVGYLNRAELTNQIDKLLLNP
jgi:thioredoxin-like negative regulator of GroEL